jgi:hypothetical protein
MPRNKSDTPPVDKIEHAFLLAIERLQLNAPRHPALQQKSRANKLRLNKCTVALEAGHSRTKVYDYPRVVAKIAGEQTPTRSSRTANEVIANLRKDCAVLKEDRNALYTAVAQLTLLRHQEQTEFERKLARKTRSEA